MPTPPAPAWISTRSPACSAGQVEQPVVGGEEDDRHRGGLLEGPCRRDRGEQRALGDRERPEGAGDQPHHPVADGEVGRPRRRPRRRPRPPRCRSAASPGYMPRAISTSRKLSPAARTATRTSAGPSGSAASRARDQREALEGAALGRRRGARAPAAGQRAAPAPPAPSRGASSHALAQGELGLLGAVARAPGSACLEASLPSLSIRAKRPGCSDAAERTRPQRPRAARSGASLSSVATAPSVRRARREPRLGLGEPTPGSRPGRASVAARAASAARSRSVSSRGGLRARSAPRRSPRRAGRPRASSSAKQALPPRPGGLQPRSASTGRSGERVDRDHRGARRRRRGRARPRPRRAWRDPHPQLPRAVGVQRDAAPGEGQRRLPGALARAAKATACRAASSRAGWTPKRPASLGLLLGAGRPRRRSPRRRRQAAVRPWKAGP